MSGSWDRGVPYETAYLLITKRLRRAQPPGVCYDSILLIQLRNGSRVSEAVRAFKAFLRERRVELEVQVSKKKRPETRLMVIPRELLDLSIPEKCAGLLEVDDERLTERVKNHCRTFYRFNTHSLRYAFITFLLRQGVSPAVVSRITGHSRLDFMLRYTQRKAAEEVLRSLEP